MSKLTVKGNASGTGTVILEAPNTNSNRTITLPDATATLASTAYVDTSIATAARMVSGTAVASTSGTAIDFTGIPSWVKRVTVMFNGVSKSGSDLILMQIGSGSFLTSGYSSAAGIGYLSSSGFAVSGQAVAANTISGSVVLSLLTGNSWVSSGVVAVLAGTTQVVEPGAGSVSLSGALDRVRITVNGTNTFDAGTINIMWEG